MALGRIHENLSFDEGMFILTPICGSHRLKLMKKFYRVFVFLIFSASCAALPARMPDTTMERASSEDRTQADAYYHFMVASMLEQEGNLDKAMSEYEQAFALDPKSAETAFSLASLSLRKGHTDQAARYAQKAIELQPDKTQALMLLAGIYTSTKKYDDAISTYRRVIAIDPKAGGSLPLPRFAFRLAQTL